MDQLQNDEEAASEEVLNDHQLKVMELIDHIRELIVDPFQTKIDSQDYLAAPQMSVSAPVSTNSPSAPK